MKRALIATCLAFGTLSAARADIGTKENVVSTAYHQFPRALAGRTLSFQKILDPQTRTLRYASSEPEIPTAGALQNLLLEERRLERKEFGALEGALRRKFQQMGPDDRIKVLITLKFPDGIKHPSKLETAQEDLERHSLNLLTVQPVVSIESFFSQHGLQILFPSEGRTGLTEVTKEDLEKVRFDPALVSVEEYHEADPARGWNWLPFLSAGFAQGNPNFSTLAASAYNHSISSVPSNAGYLVHAATVEKGLTQTFLNCIPLTPYYYETGDDAHSRLAFRCLTHAAPGARFHHRKNSPSPGYLSPTIDWIVSKSISSSSVSFNRPVLSPSHEEFRRMDDLAYRAPYTVFSNPTGNDGWEKEAAWLSYNALSVGNVQHENQSSFRVYTAGYLTGCTKTRNPQGRYPGAPCLRATDSAYTYCSSDREMPNIVAPGYSLTSGVPMAEPCESTLSLCGTSWSAPIMNGMVANVIAAHPSMYQWPEKVRAALLVTAENVDGGEWQSSTDGLDGAGVVNGAAAVNFAQTYSTAIVNGTALTKGMGYGSISTANWGSNLSYNIAIPSSIPSGKILRVVLLWDSNPSLNSATNELSDLDLSVYAAQPSGIIRYSSSYESPIEIIHFSPSEVQAGTTITASINKYANRIPSDATTNYFYYAIAWDWVDNHAP